MTTRWFSYALKAKLPGSLCLIIIGTEGFGLLPTGLGHLRALESLPALHRDPFDRMLVAQALADGFVMVSGDPAVARYGAPILW
jgi:PIN domain nuclease of toxin-antitoxin system